MSLHAPSLAVWGRTLAPEDTILLTDADLLAGQKLPLSAPHWSHFTLSKADVRRARFITYTDAQGVQHSLKNELPGQTQATEQQLAGFKAELNRQLCLCEDCRGSGEIIVTPDPLYGTPETGMNVDAGWIGYYAVICTECGIPTAGDRWFHNTLDGKRVKAPVRIPDPVTAQEHYAAMENAAVLWNGFNQETMLSE
jgi:hypothetical protein